MLVLNLAEREITYREYVGCPIRSKFDLLRILQAYNIGALVCRGIPLEIAAIIQSFDIPIIQSGQRSINDAINGIEKPLATKSRYRATA
jgi:hypothetical protein